MHHVIIYDIMGLSAKNTTFLEEAADTGKSPKMFITATIIDKAHAPQIRRQLKRTGFSYNPIFKEWVKNPMGLRGARIDLPAVKAIDGIEYKLVPAAEHHARINAAVAKTA